MDRIRMLLHRLSPRPPATGTNKRPELTWDTRDSRATQVAAMQANVSRIQQEILELSNAADSRTESDGASRGRMADLERELDTAQRELAKIQGRV